MAKPKLDKETLSDCFSQILQLGVISWHGLFIIIIIISCLKSCGSIGSISIEAPAKTANYTIAYDHRALVINGQRRFLISGSIHYPRSTPQMWPGLIELAKEGGLDVIQTYVFWDGHEQKRGKYYFEGRYDLVRFLKVVHHAGMFVNLRIGPYVCAEWNFGGLPEWLREIPGIEFRTDNEPFKKEMERFLTYIVDMMRENNLFYTQGGPIILSQVENEYGMIQAAYGDAGARYAQWAADMAVNLNTSVPWIMCKQYDYQASIIDTCNGFYCDDYTPNSFNKPMMWTENWSGWFHYWGLSRPNRPVEDLAYATALFFQRGGSYMNYYMYHGGTNFGRTSAAGVTTSYDYDAPIDEYGQARQPKWGHLKDLHAAIKLCEPAMAVVDVQPIHWSPPGLNVEVSIYVDTGVPNATEEPVSFRRPSGKHCAAFIANTGYTDVTLNFFGLSFYLPAWSVSILPDCKNVVFNTAQVAAQTTLKSMKLIAMEELVPLISVNESGDHETMNGTALEAKALRWAFARDVVGVWRNTSVPHDGLLEQINTTHDMTDYMWYTTNVSIPEYPTSSNLNVTPQEAAYYTVSLNIETVRNLVHVYVNGKPAGGHPTWLGSHFDHPLILPPGNNSIALLSATTGLSYAGPFYEKEVGGLSGSVLLLGNFNNEVIDLTGFPWIHQVGLRGEGPNLASDYEVGVSPGLNWSLAESPLHEPLVWYKTWLDAPAGDSPLVLDLRSMGKGQAWINGHHLGRYWTMFNPPEGCDEECDYRGPYAEDQKCRTECGKLSQRWYHVPREWINSTRNILVLFEEVGGNVSDVSMSTQVTGSICANIGESFPRSPGSDFPKLHLDCGAGYHIQEIQFASFGNPSGNCGQFFYGQCHNPLSIGVVEEACLGFQFCSLSKIAKRIVGGEAICPGIMKSLAVQAACAPLPPP